jgi:hypothetical protein
MSRIKVIDIKTKQVIGSLMGFAVSESGEQFAVVRPKSRSLDTLIKVIEFSSKYEVQNETK